MRIADDCVVTVQFRLSNEAGQVLESSPEGRPVAYVHGAPGVLPVLGRELTGKAAGDRFDICISPEQGFGERQPALLEVIPRAHLPNAGPLAIGATVTRRDIFSGAQVPYVVTAVDAETVTVDANHPLAGMTLRFEGLVIDVREARAQELAKP
jgi:FKBP-type peptidyl-prolyl cis-trans isomerase SlyD